MAGPITWRSVVGPQLSDAAVPLQASQRSFENMFGSLQRVLNERNQFAEQQAGAVREGNRQAFLDALQGARTPEELQALQASGSLDQLQAALTPEARASVRGAFDARLAGLRQQTLAEQSFADSQRDRAEAPLRDILGSLLARGETTAARQFLNTQDLRNEATFENALTGVTRQQQTDARQKILQDREDKRFTQQEADAAIVRRQREEAADRERQQKRLMDRLAAERLAYERDNQIRISQQTPIAKTTGIPVSADGMPDFFSATPEQLKAFDAAATAAKVPLSAAALSGDTARRDQLRKNLLESGFDPNFILSNEEAINRVYASTVRPRIGNDEMKAAVDSSKATVAREIQDRENAFYRPGSESARSAMTKLMEEIPQIAKTWSGFDPEEDVPDIQARLRTWANEGLEIIVDGKKEKVVPSANDIRAALRSSSGGWVQDVVRANNIEDTLKEWLQTPEGIARIKAGKESQNAQDLARIRELVRNQLQPNQQGSGKK